MGNSISSREDSNNNGRILNGNNNSYDGIREFRHTDKTNYEEVKVNANNNINASNIVNNNVNNNANNNANNNTKNNANNNANKSTHTSSSGKNWLKHMFHPEPKTQKSQSKLKKRKSKFRGKPMTNNQQIITNEGSNLDNRPQDIDLTRDQNINYSISDNIDNITNKGDAGIKKVDDITNEEISNNNVNVNENQNKNQNENQNENQSQIDNDKGNDGKEHDKNENSVNESQDRYYDQSGDRLNDKSVQTDTTCTDMNMDTDIDMSSSSLGPNINIYTPTITQDDNFSISPEELDSDPIILAQSPLIPDYSHSASPMSFYSAPQSPKITKNDNNLLTSGSANVSGTSNFEENQSATTPLNVLSSFGLPLPPHPPPAMQTSHRVSTSSVSSAAGSAISLSAPDSSFDSNLSFQTHSQSDPHVTSTPNKVSQNSSPYPIPIKNNTNSNNSTFISTPPSNNSKSSINSQKSVRRISSVPAHIAYAVLSSTSHPSVINDAEEERYRYSASGLFRKSQSFTDVQKIRRKSFKRKTKKDHNSELDLTKLNTKEQENKNDNSSIINDTSSIENKNPSRTKSLFKLRTRSKSKSMSRKSQIKDSNHKKLNSIDPDDEWIQSIRPPSLTRLSPAERGYAYPTLSELALDESKRLSGVSLFSRSQSLTLSSSSYYRPESISAFGSTNKLRDSLRPSLSTTSRKLQNPSYKSVHMNGINENGSYVKFSDIIDTDNESNTDDKTSIRAGTTQSASARSRAMSLNGSIRSSNTTHSSRLVRNYGNINGQMSLNGQNGQMNLNGQNGQNGQMSLNGQNGQNGQIGKIGQIGQNGNRSSSSISQITMNSSSPLNSNNNSTNNHNNSRVSIETQKVEKTDSGTLIQREENEMDSERIFTIGNKVDSNTSLPLTLHKENSSGSDFTENTESSLQSSEEISYQQLSYSHVIDKNVGIMASLSEIPGSRRVVNGQ